jgi:hypothetical protein
LITWDRSYRLLRYLFNQAASRNKGSVADKLATSLAELSPSQIPDGVDVNANIERAKVMSASEYIDAVKTGGTTKKAVTSDLRTLETSISVRPAGLREDQTSPVEWGRAATKLSQNPQAGVIGGQILTIPAISIG